MTFSRITVPGFTLFPALSDESTLHLLSYNSAEDLYKNYRLVNTSNYLLACIALLSKPKEEGENYQKYLLNDWAQQTPNFLSSSPFLVKLLKSQLLTTHWRPQFNLRDKFNALILINRLQNADSLSLQKILTKLSVKIQKAVNEKELLDVYKCLDLLKYSITGEPLTQILTALKTKINEGNLELRSIKLLCLTCCTSIMPEDELISFFMYISNTLFDSNWTIHSAKIKGLSLIAPKISKVYLNSFALLLNSCLEKADDSFFDFALNYLVALAPSLEENSFQIFIPTIATIIKDCDLEKSKAMIRFLTSFATKLTKDNLIHFLYILLGKLESSDTFIFEDLLEDVLACVTVITTHLSADCLDPFASILKNKMSHSEEVIRLGAFQVLKIIGPKVSEEALNSIAKEIPNLITEPDYYTRQLAIQLLIIISPKFSPSTLITTTNHSISLSQDPDKNTRLAALEFLVTLPCNSEKVLDKLGDELIQQMEDFQSIDCFRAIYVLQNNMHLFSERRFSRLALLLTDNIKNTELGARSLDCLTIILPRISEAPLPLLSRLQIALEFNNSIVDSEVIKCIKVLVPKMTQTQADQFLLNFRGKIDINDMDICEEAIECIEVLATKASTSCLNELGYYLERIMIGANHRAHVTRIKCLHVIAAYLSPGASKLLIVNFHLKINTPNVNENYAAIKCTSILAPKVLECDINRLGQSIINKIVSSYNCCAAAIEFFSIMAEKLSNELSNSLPEHLVNHLNNGSLADQALDCLKAILPRLTKETLRQFICILFDKNEHSQQSIWFLKEIAFILSATDLLLVVTKMEAEFLKSYSGEKNSPVLLLKAELLGTLIGRLSKEEGTIVLLRVINLLIAKENVTVRRNTPTAEFKIF